MKNIRKLELFIPKWQHTMKYRKGDRVRHPTIADWGLGEVLVDSDGGYVKIFFVGAGEKTISLEYVQPVRVQGADARHPMLDNLKITRSPSKIKYQSLSESIEYFLGEYPEGFYGKTFKQHERKYKRKAHKLALNLLGKESFSLLLQKNDYTEITKRALKVVNATNLIFKNENMYSAWIESKGIDSGNRSVHYSYW